MCRNALIIGDSSEMADAESAGLAAHAAIT